MDDGSLAFAMMKPGFFFAFFQAFFFNYSKRDKVPSKENKL
jgi:hypothetical protein